MLEDSRASVPSQSKSGIPAAGISKGTPSGLEAHIQERHGDVPIIACMATV